jgi:hypothetical protein
MNRNKKLKKHQNKKKKWTETKKTQETSKQEENEEKQKKHKKYQNKKKMNRKKNKNLQNILCNSTKCPSSISIVFHIINSTNTPRIQRKFIKKKKKKKEKEQDLFLLCQRCLYESSKPFVQTHSRPKEEINGKNRTFYLVVGCEIMLLGPHWIILAIARVWNSNLQWLAPWFLFIKRIVTARSTVGMVAQCISITALLMHRIVASQWQIINRSIAFQFWHFVMLN